MEKLNIEPKINNGTRQKLIDEGLIASEETVSNDEFNALVGKTNELVEAVNAGAPITAFNFLENVPTYEDLPLTGNQVNDGYGVLEDGLIYVWNGLSFQSKGNGMDLGLKPVGKLQPGDIRAISGGEVYDNFVGIVSENVVGKNLANSLKIFNGYISSTRLEIQGTNNSIYKTILIDSIEELTIYSISGNDLRSDARGCYFENSIGVKLKPLDIDGNEMPNGSVASNQKFMSPKGAVRMYKTISFGDGNRYNDTIQVEKGLQVTEYEPYGTFVLVKDSALSKNVAFKEDLPPVELKKMSIIFNNNLITINRGLLVESIVVRDDNSMLSNSSVNFGDIYVNNAIFKDGRDDICPPHINGSAVGGNHGWAYCIEIESVGHLKTVKDIGSVYVTQENKEIVLMRIDGNKLYFFPKEYKRLYIQSVNYLRGGKDISNITITSTKRIDNPYNFTKNRILKFIADGKIVDTTVQCNEFEIIESYDVYDMIDVALKCEENRPLEGYDFQLNYNEYEADVLCTINNNYSFVKNNLIVNTSLVFNKKATLSYWGGFQFYPLRVRGEILIPYTLPINGKDYSVISNYDKIENTINFTSNYWKYPELAPGRVVCRNNVGTMTLGFVNERKIENVANSLQLSTAQKIYPRFVHFAEPKEVKKGDVLNAVLYRNFIEHKVDDKYIVDAFVLGKKLIINVDVIAPTNEIVQISDFHQFIGNKLVSYEGDNKALCVFFNGLIPIISEGGESFTYVF